MLLGNTLSIAASVPERLSLNLRNVPLSRFIREIESKTDYTFFINDTRVDVKTLVSANESNASLEEVLRNVFASTNYTYEIVEKQILVQIKAVSASPEQSAKKTIRGVVVDENGDPAIGANVLESGTTNGTITDINGTFTLDVDPANKIHITMIGYVPQELAVGNRTNFEITMLEDTQLLDEVVVIGYGVVKKSDLTGAVSSVSGKDLQVNIAKSAAGALQGKIAGVTVSSINGQPGSGMSINIRGLSSINNTNDPLYLIDGIYGDINLVDPTDIASLEVLKDASAAAIYGSRAANGVVLITTKSGKKNSPVKVDINLYAGFQNATKELELMDANEWISVLKETHYAGKEVPESIKNWDGSKGTNWQEEGFRTAFFSKSNVNISGGGTNSTYSVSAGYTTQEGVLHNSSYDAFNIRTKNMFYLLNDHIRVGNTFLIKSWKQRRNQSSLIDYMRMSPMVPVYDENQLGGFGARDWTINMDNPIGSSKLNNNQRRGTDILLNAFVEIDLFLPGLKYKMNGGFNKYDGRKYNYNPEYNFGSGDQKSKLSESASFEEQWLLENTLHYDNTFGKHTISGLLGYSAQKNKYRDFGASRRDLPVGTWVIGSGSTAEQETFGEARENTMLSMFSRVMYSYDSRYMLSASIRRDGSSRFAAGHRYGNFPSVSAGWNIMNESFMNKSRTWLDELKVRASYGILGNQEIKDYVTQSTVTKGLNYLLGNPAYMWEGGITGDTWVSPRYLTWEKTKTFNIGLDGTFLNGKLSFTADYYVQRVEDLLLNVNMPLSIGMKKKPTMNAGTIENKGFELSVTHRNNVGDVYYTVGANIATVRNQVKEVTLGNTQEFEGWKGHDNEVINYAKVGKPIGAFYLLKTDGLFQSDEEIRNHVDREGNLLQPDARPGDIRFLRGDDS